MELVWFDSPGKTNKKLRWEREDGKGNESSLWKVPADLKVQSVCQTVRILCQMNIDVLVFT